MTAWTRQCFFSRCDVCCFYGTGKKNPSALYLKIHHKHRLIWIVWLLKRLQNASSDFVVIHFKWGTEVASCLNLLTFFCLQCLSRQLWPSEEDTVVAFKDRGQHIHVPETTFTCTIILLFVFFFIKNRRCARTYPAERWFLTSEGRFNRFSRPKCF